MQKILAELNSKPWLIMSHWLTAISNVANGKEILSNIDNKFVVDQISQRKEALSNQNGSARENERLTEQRGDVGILNITGPIIRYGGMMEISGYCSLQRCSDELKKLEDDNSVKTIVLKIDSPGGQASGIDQFANMVSKSNKRTIAYVDDLAASAGYWMASAANEIVASSTSMVGSIGVVYSLADDSKKKSKEGVRKIEIVSTISPKKRPDISSEEGQAQIQSWADKLGAKFINAVAKNRNVSAETVMGKFGQGDLLISDDALEVGMIDSIKDYETLMDELQSGNNTTNLNQNIKGATAMTAEELQKQHPDAYNTIYGAGATSERVRIQAIEEAIPMGYENVKAISALKFDGKSDAKDVKVACFDHDQTQKAKVSDDIKSDGKELAKQAETIADVSSETKKVDGQESFDASADAAIAKLNERRGK